MFSVCLIGAIFMKELPVEFNTVLGAFFIAIGGGWPLMSIGMFSYLTEVTEEKDRVFRFGIMFQIFPIISICTLPFSGILYQKMGYISMKGNLIKKPLMKVPSPITFFLLPDLISMCMLINFIGILYIVFVMEEPKPRVKEVTDKELVVMLPETKSGTTIEPVTDTKGNICTNVIKDCVLVVAKKRTGNGRKIVYIILVIIGLSQALDIGMTTIVLSDR